MPIQKFRPTYTFDEDRLNALKAIVPEAFADGAINWDTLHDLLADHLEDESPDAEHFGLTWPGKRQARRLAGKPSKGTLIPAPGEGVNEETTRNLFIEGDNLEVLKLLQKSYAGRVKMIYIDPPYNTGKDFVYPDDYSEPLESYLRRTGQKGESGELLTSNPKSDGRFHSNWLNMMYPRLRLARNLLRDDGVIFVSIDDNEMDNLRLVMDEVFGEENFAVQIPWQSRQSVQNDTDISNNHEYILAYARQRRQQNRRLKEKNVETWFSQQDFAFFPLPLDKSNFSNPDNDPRGLWKADPFDAPNIRPNLTYPIINPNTGEEHWPPHGRCWRTEQEKYLALLNDGRIIFGRTGKAKPQLKVFYREKEMFGSVENTWFDGESSGTATKGTQELQGLFDGVAYFDSPKPTTLLKRLLKLTTKDSDLVIDFFAGSATTAHAVLKLNREDGGNRRFIMVQLPEPTPENSPARNAGFETIAEIGKERIRRVIAKMKAEDMGKLDLATRDTPEDLGFKVFKLARSNFKQWDGNAAGDVDTLQTHLDEFVTPLVDDWQEENLLTEIILQQGFPLDSAVAPLDGFTHNRVIAVTSDFHEYRLVVCLDRSIHPDTIAALHLNAEDVFVCLDSALTDEAKARLSDICNLYVI